jgi:hypothetical protein
VLVLFTNDFGNKEALEPKQRIMHKDTTMNKVTVLGLTAFAILLGCSSPREQCVYNAQSPRLIAMNDRSIIAQNLERGYAIHKQQVPYSYEGQCQDKNLKYYSCIINASRTQETPVAIDMQREETKLKQLDAKIKRLAEDERRQVAECNLLPDD